MRKAEGKGKGNGEGEKERGSEEGGGGGVELSKFLSRLEVHVSKLNFFVEAGGPRFKIKKANRCIFQGTPKFKKTIELICDFFLTQFGCFGHGRRQQNAIWKKKSCATRACNCFFRWGTNQ